MNRVNLWVVWALCLAFAACATYEHHLARGDELLAQGLWESAEDEYSQAQKEDPFRSEAKQRIVAARQKRADASLQRALAARQAKDLDAALAQFAEAARVAPAYDRATLAYDAAIRERLSFAEADLKASSLESAEGHIQGVLKIQPDSKRAKDLSAQVQLAYAQKFFHRGTVLEQQGKLGNALLEYLRADERMAGVTQARERAFGVRKKLREALAFYVAVTPVSDHTSSPDIAQRLSAGKLAQALGDQVPFKVVTHAPTNARGVRLSASLERVLLSPDKSVIQKTQRYLAGTRSVENPARVGNEQKVLAAQRKLEELEEQLTAILRQYTDAQGSVDRVRDALDSCVGQAFIDCQKTLDACRAAGPAPKADGSPSPCANRCSAESCVAAKDKVLKAETAREQLRRKLDDDTTALARQGREVQRQRDEGARTPLTVEEPMYADYVYDVEVHSLSARAVVTLHLDDLAAEPARQPLTQDYLVSRKDETHRGYDRYGILADPLVLPNEAELRIELGDKALADLAQQVKAKFEHYRKTVLDEARKSLVRAAAEDAIETLVRAVVVSADQPPKDMLTALAQARGLKRPDALLE